MELQLNVALSDVAAARHLRRNSFALDGPHEQLDDSHIEPATSATKIVIASSAVPGQQSTTMRKKRSVALVVCISIVGILMACGIFLIVAN